MSASCEQIDQDSLLCVARNVARNGQEIYIYFYMPFCFDLEIDDCGFGLEENEVMIYKGGTFRGTATKGMSFSKKPEPYWRGRT